MSDQPGIPAIAVFPPFNPGQRPAGPATQPIDTAASAPPSPTPAQDEAAEPAEAAPWHQPAADSAPAAEAQAQHEPPPSTADEDLPWLEVPAPPHVHAAEEEIKADEEPNWMDWVRSDEPASSTDEATPIADLQADDAQPWAPETETAADDWAPGAPAEPWKATDAADDAWRDTAEPNEPTPADAWDAPIADSDPWLAPDAPAAAPEDAGETDAHPLFDLPEVPPSAPAPGPWTAAEAPLFEPAAHGDTPAEEPAWEMPSSASAEPDEALDTAWAPEAGVEPSPAAQPEVPADGEAPTATAATAAPGASASAPRVDLGGVADRLQAIADALRSDPAGFLAGRHGGDPLGLLVTGFVLGYQAGTSS